MTKEQVITDLYRSHFVERYIRTISNSEDSQFVDDYTGELWLMICEIPEQNLIALYNERGLDAIRQFVSGIIYRQIRSTNSLLFRRYKMMSRLSIPASSVEDFETRYRTYTDRVNNNMALY